MEQEKQAVEKEEQEEQALRKKRAGCIGNESGLVKKQATVGKSSHWVLRRCRQKKGHSFRKGAPLINHL